MAEGPLACDLSLGIPYITVFNALPPPIPSVKLDLDSLNFWLFMLSHVFHQSHTNLTTLYGLRNN